MECVNARESGSFVLVARRNSSLTCGGRNFVVGSLVLISTIISLGFASLGAWMVLPFAGAEMLVVYCAFRYVARHASDFESISIDADRVTIERWEMGRVSRFEFNRYWAQLVTQPVACRGGDMLALRSHGRQVEFGRYLTEEQRREVARAIKAQLNVHYR
jgi:uncharacterized membrane protein